MNDRSRTKAKVVPISETNDIRLVSEAGDQGSGARSNGLGASGGQREEPGYILSGNHVGKFDECPGSGTRTDTTSQVGTPVIRRISGGGIEARTGVYAPRVMAWIFSIIWLSMFMFLIALAVEGWR